MQLKGDGPIILAFSGGLDTCAILTWLKEHYDRDVIAYCANVGEDSPAIEERAKELGAVEIIFEDLQDEFVKDYVWPMLKSGATYQKDYLLGTAIARPLIAKGIAALAKQVGASAIVHGATGKGNDQLRFEQAWAYLVPDIPVIAPWKTWSFKGREDLLDYLASKGIAYEFPNKTFSIDANLLHVSYEGGPLESLETNAYEVLDLEPKKSEALNVEISFHKGEVAEIKTPEETFDASADPAGALKLLNKIGQDYAIGIEDLVEERVNGIKSRGVYLTPGGSIVQFALGQLKQICWDMESYKLAESLGPKLGEYIYNGEWFCPPSMALQAMYDQLSTGLTGTISLTVVPHAMKVVGRKAGTSLYDANLVSFDSDEHGINEASKGFCVTRNLKYKQLGKIAQTAL